jgi:hypothetical protein
VLDGFGKYYNFMSPLSFRAWKKEKNGHPLEEMCILDVGPTVQRLK